MKEEIEANNIKINQNIVQADNHLTQINNIYNFIFIVLFVIVFAVLVYLLYSVRHRNAKSRKQLIDLTYQKKDSLLALLQHKPTTSTA